MPTGRNVVEQAFVPRTSASVGSATGGYSPDETRRALLQSALTLFGTKGYASTSVQELVEAAGVTKGAFYHHFESKEDLLRLIHDEFVDDQLTELERILQEYADPAEQLAQLLLAFILSVEQYSDNVTIFYQERRFLTGDRFSAVKEKRDRFEQLFLGVLERGMELGVFRADIDPRTAGLAILGMCAWTNQWYRRDGGYTAQDIAEQLSALALNGLRA